MGCGNEKLSKYLTQTFTAHCNAMICQQVTLSGDAEWLKVADAVIESGDNTVGLQLPRFNFVTHCVTIPLCSPFAASSGTLGMLPTLPAIVLYLKRWKKSA